MTFLAWGHPTPPPASSVSSKSACGARMRKHTKRAPTVSAAIHGCSLVLAHAPDLVRHGSKPTREDAADQIAGAPHLRGRARLPAAPGLHREPRPRSALGDRAPVVGQPRRAEAEGPFGVFVDQEELYARMEAADQFQLLQLDGREAATARSRSTETGRAPASWSAPRPRREPLGGVLLENLACKATGALALEHLLARTGFPPRTSTTRSAAARRRSATATSGAAATSARRSPSRPAANASGLRRQGVLRGADPRARRRGLARLARASTSTSPSSRAARSPSSG